MGPEHTGASGPSRKPVTHTIPFAAKLDSYPARNALVVDDNGEDGESDEIQKTCCHQLRLRQKPVLYRDLYEKHKARLDKQWTEIHEAVSSEQVLSVLREDNVLLASRSAQPRTSKDDDTDDSSSDPGEGEDEGEDEREGSKEGRFLGGPTPVPLGARKRGRGKTKEERRRERAERVAFNQKRKQEKADALEVVRREREARRTDPNADEGDIRLPDRMVDLYHLWHTDGLKNRRADLSTNHQRLLRLNAYVLPCRNPDCLCVYEYADHPTIDYALHDERMARESVPLTFFLHPNRIVRCRLCKSCLICPVIESCDCEHVHSAVRFYKEPQRSRTFLRLIWRLLTLNGLIVSVYNFFVDRVEYAALGLGITLIYNLDDNLTSYYGGAGMGSGEDAPILTPEQIRRWLTSFAILILLVFALKFLKLLEFVNFQMFSGLPSSTIRRLKRRRFTDITTDVEAVDKHTQDYSYMYFSDDEDEGFNDPDIAFVNFTQPPDANVWRRFRKMIFLF